MKHTIQIVNPQFQHPQVMLSVGDSFEFGRDISGAGCISERSAVSRIHGRIEVTDHGFSVVTLGSQIGVTVTDRTTPSKLVIPRETGPVPISFRECSIIVDLPDQQDYLDVTVTGSDLADRWAEAWRPQMRDRWFDTERRYAPSTYRLIQDGPIKWHKTNGAAYAWYRTLVALCTPALGETPAGTPTNAHLCDRLHQSKSVTERHLTQIYEAFGLHDEARDREIVVMRAIHLGIVTRQDMHELG